MEGQNIPKEKFRLADPAEHTPDQNFHSRPVGYFRDAMGRFMRNRSSVAAAIIIILLFLFAILAPIVSPYDVSFRDGYYKRVRPKWEPLAFLGWDGCSKLTGTQAAYDYYKAIGLEYGGSSLKKVERKTVDANTGKAYYRLKVDSYEKVGFIYVDLSTWQYEDLQKYQDETKRQVCYPISANYKTHYLAVSSGANLWYQLQDDSPYTAGASAHHDADGEPVFVANYLTGSRDAGSYQSLRIPGDDGKDGNWYVYAIKNQTGYRCRVLYSEYYRYINGFSPAHLFGTNQHGQDILVNLAHGARLSFLLAISVSVLNFFIGIGYGAVEGYYGGNLDLVMGRLSDILSSVPFIVVATLFQLHLAKKVGPVPSLLFAFVLTGWIGIAARVRTQFYRFKNAEYVLASRTLGAGDGRLIFRHILPNAVGTIITGTILIIPGVIFSESMLSYLGIVNLEAAGMTSIGTMLANGRQYLNTQPHILAFPAVFIALLEISFNLFGNGLRDAFNPSLRGAEE